MGEKKVVGGSGITAGGDVTIKDITGQVAIGEYINQYQFKIEKPSGEALVKLLDYLDRKRQESVNKEILDSYTPSALPDYPPRLREFVTENRVDELTQALIYLQDHRILLISGIGGVGKTTLARGLIETRPANVPLPFWFDFGKKMDAKLGDLLEQLASYMNTPNIAKFKQEGREAGQDDINRLAGELQKRGLIWLVFDNLETILDGVYFRDPGIDSLFTSLRDSTHQAKVIVTSRTLPQLRNSESLIDVIEEEKKELKGLKISYAVDYLSKNGLDGVEREKLEELARGVDGHPLALRLLIELVKKVGVSDTLNDLSVYQRRKEDTIKKARRLFDKLAGDEKELLERISVYRQPEPMDAIKTMFTDKTSLDAVEILIDKSLLETDHKGNYWLHPLVREFAYDDLEHKKEAHKVAIQYYLSQPIPEERSEKEDVQSLIEVCYHACMAGDYDLAADIIFDNKLHEDLDRWGNYTTLVELYEKLLPEHFDEKPKLRSIKTHGGVLGNLGTAYSALGQMKRAIEYYKQALAIAREIGDRRSEGSCLGGLGNSYFALGDMERAIDYYEPTLIIAREIGDRRLEGNTLGSLGNSYSALDYVEGSIEYQKQALTIYRKIGDRSGESNSLGSMGNAYARLGDLEHAIEYHKQALTIAREIRHRRLEGNWLGNLGNVYRDLGDAKQAIEYYKNAWEIAQEIGDREGEDYWLGNLGNVYADLGEEERAIEYFEQALTIAREIGDRGGEGYLLNALGRVFEDLIKYDFALACYLLARKIRIEIRDPDIEITENNINELRNKIGEEEFKKLKYAVEPKAEWIVQSILGS